MIIGGCTQFSELWHVLLHKAEEPSKVPSSCVLVSSSEKAPQLPGVSPNHYHTSLCPGKLVSRS